MYCIFLCSGTIYGSLNGVHFLYLGYMRVMGTAWLCYLYPRQPQNCLCLCAKQFLQLNGAWFPDSVRESIGSELRQKTERNIAVHVWSFLFRRFEQQLLCEIKHQYIGGEFVLFGKLGNDDILCQEVVYGYQMSYPRDTAFQIIYKL